MGLLVDGQWHDQWYDTKSSDGRFIRQEAQFRHNIGSDDFPAESGRYHLFVSLACPWAHRTLIFRALKDLEEHISVTVVDPLMLENGWEFSSVSEHNPIEGVDFMHQIYTLADPNYSGRVTVPVLWDKQQQRIVNNESAEIIRILNTAFNDLTGNQQDYYPNASRADIDAINEQVYDTINNGVYRCGFATSQGAYQEAFTELFDNLDHIEQRLSQQRYLVGNNITEADWRLFTTLVRFDAVYYGHFKTNLRRIEDYPNISEYLRELYQIPGVANTVNMAHIKQHYYMSHTMINPTQVVPAGPAVDYARPHRRDEQVRLPQ